MSEHLQGAPSAHRLPTRPLVVHRPLHRKLFEASHPLNTNTCFLLSSYPADTIFSDFTVQTAAARLLLAQLYPLPLARVTGLPAL